MQRKMLSLGLAGVMALSAPLSVAYAESTSEALFNTLSGRVNTLMTNGYAQPVADLYVVLSELQNLDFKAQAKAKMSDLTHTEQELLMSAGIYTEDDLAKIYTALISQFPQSAADLQASGSTNIFAKMLDVYETGGDGSLGSDDYASLSAEMSKLGKSAFNDFPSVFQGMVKTITPSGKDPLDTFQIMLNEVLAVNLGSVTKVSYLEETNNNHYKTLDLAIDGDSVSSILTALGKSGSVYTATGYTPFDDNAADIVNGYYITMEMFLDIIDETVSGAVTPGTETIEDATSRLFEGLSLITVAGQTVDDSEDDDDNGGGGGGGNTGGGGGTTPDPEPTDPDPVDEDEDDEPDTTPEQPDQPGESDPDEVFTSDATDEADDVFDDLDDQTAEEAFDSVKDVAEALGKELEETVVTEIAISQIVDKAIDTVDKILDKEDITAEQAEEIVVSAIESTITAAVEKDTNGANLHGMNQKAQNMAAQAIKKAGKVESQGTQTVTETGAVKTEFVLADIQTVLDQSVKTTENIVDAVQSAGLAQAVQEINPTIAFTAPVATPGSELVESVMALAQDIVEAVQAANANVDVAISEDTSISIPAEAIGQVEDAILELITETVEFDFDAVFQTAPEPSTEPGTETAPEPATTLEPIGDALQVSVEKTKEDGTREDVEFTKANPLVITLAIDFGAFDTFNPALENMLASAGAAIATGSEVTAADEHLLGAYLLNEATGNWEYVKSWVEDGSMVVEATKSGQYAVMKTDVNYTDIDGHWAQKTIEEMTAKRIVFGETATGYKPDQAITRAEFAAFLVNLTELEGEVRGNFKDIPADAWYYDAVGLAGINGLVSGVGNGNFAPDATVTRQDMAVMMAKAYKLANGVAMTGNSKDFVDSALISDYAVDSVEAARYQAIIGGFKDGTFQPKKTATRAEAAQMVKALWEK